MKFYLLAIALTLQIWTIQGFGWHLPKQSVSQPIASSSVGEIPDVSRRQLLISAAPLPLLLLLPSAPADARLESVNRPELLPKENGLNVIQIEKFLTSGQARRMNDLLGSLERDTGFRVRVLCQNYPNTPGLAIRDYWDLGKEVRAKSSVSTTSSSTNLMTA
jgi:hypothetical protein